MTWPLTAHLRRFTAGNLVWQQCSVAPPPSVFGKRTSSLRSALSMGSTPGPRQLCGRPGALSSSRDERLLFLFPTSVHLPHYDDFAASNSSNVLCFVRSGGFTPHLALLCVRCTRRPPLGLVDSVPLTFWHSPRSAIDCKLERHNLAQADCDRVSPLRRHFATSRLRHLATSLVRLSLGSMST